MRTSRFRSASAGGAALWISWLFAAAAAAETRFTVPLPGPGEAVVLEASVFNGALRIESLPAGATQIEVTLGNEGDPLPVEEEQGLWAVPAIGLTVETLENRAVLKTRWTRPLIVRLGVPRQARLELQTVMGGDVELRDLDGAIEIKANNSDVVGRSLGGPIVVSSIEGSIDIEFAAVKVAPAASLVTWSGDVRVVLAPEVGVDLRLKAVSGEIDSDVPLAAPAAAGNPRQRSELRGRVGSGGADVRMESYKGSLTVRRP
ncbi:MAG: hypothetical protein AAF690_16860 [Acidobacteriota bacterium]